MSNIEFKDIEFKILCYVKKKMESCYCSRVSYVVLVLVSVKCSFFC